VFSEEFQPEWETKREAFLKRHAGPSAQGRAAEVLAQRIVEVTSGQPTGINSSSKKKPQARKDPSRVATRRGKKQ